MIESMRGLESFLMHYACMCSSKKMSYKSMPLELDDSKWGSLLGACRIHKCIKLGKMITLKAFDLKPSEPNFMFFKTYMQQVVDE